MTTTSPFGKGGDEKIFYISEENLQLFIGPSNMQDANDLL